MGMQTEQFSSVLELALPTEVDAGGAEAMSNREAEQRLAEERYGLEIFQRAILEGDQQAWALLQDRFSDLVRAWIRRHPKREIAIRLDSEENYIAQAFERFWQATAFKQDLQFTSLAAALSYLRASLNGAIMDTLRTYARPREASLSTPGYEGVSVSEDGDDGGELWEILKSLLPQRREQYLAYLLFHCGLKPREVVRYCSQEFHSVQEVYRLRRNIVERLLRQADQLRWRLSVH
ncbi:hypothetical protein [Thermogemmatispora carboxidivorans]|uniref:hypothetical protein n=1 Tax=Thermogemmatispora carboxidivorans TaxID=1382306 RepID=UPI00069A5E80|nr:hypothetical protein [Thermogemmatispora carboxidivorans]